MYYLKEYWSYHLHKIRAGIRLAFGWCPACPRRIKQGHKMDCSYGRRK